LPDQKTLANTIRYKAMESRNSIDSWEYWNNWLYCIR